MKSKGRPFIFLKYDSAERLFYKYTIRSGVETAVAIPLQSSDIDIEVNDVFIPILWLFEESIVEDYITKVLRTNPFCSVRHGYQAYRNISLDQTHLSRRRIGSQYFIP